jgi:hypothetical protein
MILTIDPGVSIGIAIHMPAGYSTYVAQGEEAIWVLLAEYPWKVVVIENFLTSGRISKYGLYRMVGGVQSMCYHLGLQLAVQMPAARYPYESAAKGMLKAYPHEVHEVAALAHLLRWEGDHKEVLWLETLSNRVIH